MDAGSAHKMRRPRVTNRNLHAQLFEQTAAISRQQHAAAATATPIDRQAN